MFLLYSLLRNILDFLEHYLGKLLSSQQKTKVRRKKIIFWIRGYYDEFTEIPSPLHFFGVGYESVDYNFVLADNVTLYTVCNDVAVFVETPHHIYNTFRDPYFVESQFYKASHVITMPISIAFRLSEELGDPGVKVVSLAHTGRAVSTLIAQILNKLGRYSLFLCQIHTDVC